jgi:hypothetical protein
MPSWSPWDTVLPIFVARYWEKEKFRSFFSFARARACVLSDQYSVAIYDWLGEIALHAFGDIIRNKETHFVKHKLHVCDPR